MFKKISSLFTKTKKEEIIEEIQEEEVIEEPKEEPPELPKVIEVPWPQAARLKNIDNAIDKTHDDFKEFLYKNKITEQRTFTALKNLEDMYDELELGLKEQFKIPKDVEYVFELPQATGRPGFLKKKE